MEEPATRRWWKDPRFWIPTTISAIAMTFQITGPIPRDWLQTIPGALGFAIVWLTGILSRFGIHIAVLALIFLVYLRRRDAIKALGLIREWLYIRPLAYLLRPVVKRIISVPASDTVVAGRPGWKVDGKWEIREVESSNWETGPDCIRGKESGTALWNEPLPKACRIEFEARITADKGSDEIDVIVGDVMMLYYRDGVRLDWMNEDLNRDRNKRMVGRPAPQLSKWYRYLLEVTDKNKCTATIDGEKILDFDCNLGRSSFTGRLGFAHWRNSIEVKNLRIDT